MLVVMLPRTSAFYFPPGLQHFTSGVLNWPDKRVRVGSDSQEDSKLELETC